jgi:2-polyprenyl-3-methyl-5-hydroxy-6-metoxy-1,4-benzoquinol methylase
MTLPQLQEEDLPHLYSTYYPRKNLTAGSVAEQAIGVTSHRSKLRRWWSGTDNQGQYSVRPGERMLDIGCGSGLSLLEARALGAEALGIEADQNVQPIAVKLGLMVHQGNLGDYPFPELKFDLVVLNQVIEHLPRPDLTLDLIRERLAPGGRVLVVFPNINSLSCRLFGKNWINWHIPYHLHHFNIRTFSMLAKNHGYEIGHVRTITPNLWTLLQLRASNQTAECGKPSPLWAQSSDPVPSSISTRRGKVRSFLRRASVITLMFPIGIINRLTDGMGAGDSLMVELTPTKLQ